MIKKGNILNILQYAPYFILTLGLLLGGCAQEDTAPIASPELLDTGAESVIYRMVTLLTVNGVQEARVEADTAYAYPDSTVYSLRNPLMILYTPQGVERARVVSKRGRLNLTTKELIANGDVVLTIPEGDRRVESQELQYDPNGDQIWSDSATTMWEGTTVTRGQSFRSDLQFQRAVVLNGSITQEAGPRPSDTTSSARPGERPPGG